MQIAATGGGREMTAPPGSLLAHRRGAWRGANTLRLLAAQQMSARHEQISQGASDNEAMSVLVEPAIAYLGKPEHPLDDPDRMLDPRFREGRLLARTFDLVRFLARSIGLTRPR